MIHEETLKSKKAVSHWQRQGGIKKAIERHHHGQSQRHSRLEQRKKEIHQPPPLVIKSFR